MVTGLNVAWIIFALSVVVVLWNVFICRVDQLIPNILQRKYSISDWNCPYIIIDKKGDMLSIEMLNFDSGAPLGFMT